MVVTVHVHPCRPCTEILLSILLDTVATVPIRVGRRQAGGAARHVEESVYGRGSFPLLRRRWCGWGCGFDVLDDLDRGSFVVGERVGLVDVLIKDNPTRDLSRETIRDLWRKAKHSTVKTRHCTGWWVLSVSV